MKLSPFTILTTVGAVQFVTGLHRDVILERATGSSLFGGFQWVFNVAPDPVGELPLLRFWTTELLDSTTGYKLGTNKLTLDQALASILKSSRVGYHSGEVETVLFSISGSTLMRLRPELNGKLEANSSFFPREGLEKFLRRRWLGAEQVRCGVQNAKEAVA